MASKSLAVLVLWPARSSVSDSWVLWQRANTSKTSSRSLAKHCALRVTGNSSDFTRETGTAGRFKSSRDIGFLCDLRVLCGQSNRCNVEEPELQGLAPKFLTAETTEPHRGFPQDLIVLHDPRAWVVNQYGCNVENADHCR